MLSARLFDARHIIAVRTFVRRAPGPSGDRGDACGRDEEHLPVQQAAVLIIINSIIISSSSSSSSSSRSGSSSSSSSTRGCDEEYIPVQQLSNTNITRNIYTNKCTYMYMF